MAAAVAVEVITLVLAVRAQLERVAVAEAHRSFQAMVAMA
jgi:hypothetical protein